MAARNAWRALLNGLFFEININKINQSDDYTIRDKEKINLEKPWILKN